MAIKFSPKEPSKDAPKETARPTAKEAKPAKAAHSNVDDAAVPVDDRGAGDLFKAEPKPSGRKQKFRS